MLLWRWLVWTIHVVMVLIDMLFFSVWKNVRVRGGTLAWVVSPNFPHCIQHSLFHRYFVRNCAELRSMYTKRVFYQCFILFRPGLFAACIPSHLERYSATSLIGAPGSAKHKVRNTSSYFKPRFWKLQGWCLTSPTLQWFIWLCRQWCLQEDWLSRLHPRLCVNGRCRGNSTKCLDLIGVGASMYSVKSDSRRKPLGRFREKLKISHNTPSAGPHRRRIVTDHVNVYAKKESD